MSYADAKVLKEVGTFIEASPATNFLAEIENRTGRDDGWVTSINDIVEAWNLLGDEQSEYELLFAKEFRDSAVAPVHCSFLGYDAAYFISDHFSCICDALFFPRWHGTDPEGVLFKDHYARLNQNGLFDTNELTLDYLRYYLSFDWTERDDNFTSIEVYAVDISEF